MINKVKILLGAVVIAVVACLSYYGLISLLPFIESPEMPDIVILILGMGILFLVPIIGIIIRAFYAIGVRKDCDLVRSKVR